MVISLIKDSSNEGRKWLFHTSLRAQALKTALTSAAELRERKVERSTAGCLCQYSTKWLNVVRVNQELSCKLSTSKGTQSGMVFPANPGNA